MVKTYDFHVISQMVGVLLSNHLEGSMVVLTYVHKFFTFSPPPLNMGAKEALCEFPAAFIFVTRTLVFRTRSCHIRSPTLLRSCFEEAKAMLKRPWVGILVDSATEIPADSQQPAPAMRVSHLRCQPQVTLDDCSPTYVWGSSDCGHLRDPK